MHFTIFIPTYNREKDLEKCLFSIREQNVLPNEILIIDDGDLPNDFIKKWKESFNNLNIDFIYYKKDHTKERRGLSESKNKALELIKNNIFFILDDDVILELDFCEKIIDIWKNNKDENLIGVGGLIKNRRKRLFFENFYYKFFGINSKNSWDVNKIGFQIWNEEIKEISKGYYAHGGVCSYNLAKTQKLKFTTFSGGRTGLEDVDFCLRAKNNNYHFIIQPKAELYHYPSMAKREGIILSGFKESFNRWIIFKNNNKKPNLFILIWFYWANFGWILRQLLTLNFRKTWGMIKGFIASQKNSDKF